MLAATTRPWYLPTWVSRQMPVTSPIAHRRSPARSGASTGIPVTVDLDAHRFEPDVGHPGAPAGGDQHPVAAQLATVLELQDIVIAVAAGGSRVRAEAQPDAVAAQDLAERLAQRGGLPSEHMLGALDQ